MCIFTGAVRSVAATRIFARRDGEGRQTLVYAMSVALDGEVAMVLPLPVVVGAGEDAVEFLDLSGYATLFDDLERAFPDDEPASLSYPGAIAAAFAAPTALVVHDVGDFEASFVPTVADFTRLDPRFQLPDSVWQALPAYRDWGFAVFKLRTAGAPTAPTPGWWQRFGSGATPAPPAPARKNIHPMAFSFPSRRPDALFFPTVHVHDGRVQRDAAFDHVLFCQISRHARAAVRDEAAWTAEQLRLKATGLLPPIADDVSTWRRSPSALGMSLSKHDTHGVVDRWEVGFRKQLRGMLRNEDTWVGL